MKHILVGRFASGKSYFADRCMENGFKVTQSYTTRPKYTNNETGHIFITPEKAAQIQNKVTQTEHNGYQYFLTKEQIEDADIIITDPEGVAQLSKRMPDTMFYIIYMNAEFNDRFEHAIIAKDDKEQYYKENRFYNRTTKEDEMFTNFEETVVYKQEVNYPNIGGVFRVDNEYNNETFADIIELIRNGMTLHNTVRDDILPLCIDNDVLDTNDEGKIRVYSTDKNGETQTSYVSLDCFTHMVIADDEGMARIMKQWLLITHTVVPSLLDAIYSYNPDENNNTNTVEFPDI